MSVQITIRITVSNETWGKLTEEIAPGSATWETHELSQRIGAIVEGHYNDGGKDEH